MMMRNTQPPLRANDLLGAFCVRTRFNLVNHFAGESVAAAPKRTFWTRTTVGIINALLMRTSDDPVDHRDRHHVMLRQESANLLRGFLVSSQVTILRVPPLKKVNFGTFASGDTNRYLRGATIVRPVESNRCHRITAETLASPFE
ncbi:MAG: hypothetical protein QOH42_1297 [Blastocatellia bacterium]|nr:hypothetical protein [Blastocatellia bacterium]